MSRRRRLRRAGKALAAEISADLAPAPVRDRYLAAALALARELDGVSPEAGQRRPRARTIRPAAQVAGWLESCLERRPTRKTDSEGNTDTIANWVERHVAILVLAITYTVAPLLVFLITSVLLVALMIRPGAVTLLVLGLLRGPIFRVVPGGSLTARWVAGAVVRMLPAVHHARYAEEFAAELADLPRRRQILYALRQAGQGWRLRRDLRDTLTPAREG